MKKALVLLVVLVMFGVFNNSLYSYVESQVEGVIVDDQTGLPLKGAYIELISGVTDFDGLVDYSEWTLNDSVSSDTNGIFKFKHVSSGKYFLQIFMDGYSVLGPLLYNDKGYAEITFWDQYRGFIENQGIKLDISKIKIFNVKEGRIKHLKIRLKKEAILKVNVFAKYPGVGTIPFKKDFGISIKHEKIVNERDYDGDKKTGTFVSKYLKAGKVKVEIGVSNYSYQNFEINLENGKTKEKNCILDFTKGEIVYGIIKDKNGEPIEGTSIGIYPLNDEKLPSRSASTDINGKYWLGDLKPGVYDIYITGFGFKKIIQLKLNEKFELNKEF